MVGGNGDTQDLRLSVREEGRELTNCFNAFCSLQLMEVIFDRMLGFLNCCRRSGVWTLERLFGVLLV